MATKPAAKPSPIPPPVPDRGGKPDPDQVRTGMEQVKSNFELFLIAQKLVSKSGGVNEAIALVELVPLLNEVSATMTRDAG